MNVVSSSLNDLNFTKKELLSFSQKNIVKHFGVDLFPFLLNHYSQMDDNHLGEVVLSKNNNFIAINFDIKNKKMETHKIYVFDTNFNMIFESLITKDIKDRLFDYNSITVNDSNGSVFFLGKSFENNSRKLEKNGKANYYFELYKVDPQGTSKLDFKYPDKFIASLNLINNKDKVSAVGFYGDNEIGEYNGVCALDINPNSMEVIQETFNKFSKQFLHDKYGSEQKSDSKKKQNGIRRLIVKNVHLLPNGETLINAEKQFTTEHSSGTNGSFSIYHYNDIVSVMLNNDGSLKWSRNINKRQTGLLNTSFTAIPFNGNSYFFINTSDDIKKLKDKRYSFRDVKPNKSNLYMITIDNKGDISYKKLLDNKSSKVYYRVMEGIGDPKNGNVILIGKKSKSTQVLKINL